MPLSIVILAAGHGTRMRSRQPKVLQPLGGRPLLAHVLDTARTLADDIHVVYGHGGNKVPDAFPSAGVHWVLQKEQLGTGHAVSQAIDGIPAENNVLVLYGDVPLIETETLKHLVDSMEDADLALLTTKPADPNGYGRIVRNMQGAVERIVEHKDATERERRIDEVNTGVLVTRARRLREWLGKLDNDNAQGEYYLTDVVSMASGEGLRVTGVVAEKAEEVHGINDRAQLAEAERLLRVRHAHALMRQGVTLIDPSRVDIRGSLQCGLDVVIDVNVVFEGNVKLGDGVIIGPGCVIRDVQIGDGTRIEALCHLESAEIGKQCRIGPYARLRPDARLADEVHIGNFVEVKKSNIGRGSKANHLAYLGDASIGEGVNVGAGTITCNYDGANKHRTVIEDGAFIGSNASLVAPIRIGRDAVVGAGSTLSKDAPPGALTVSRARQATIEGWQRPRKNQEKEK